MRRTTSAILFAALLLGGILLRPSDEVLSWVLIGAAALPLIHVLALWRLR